MRYLVLIMMCSFTLNAFATASDDAQEYTLQKQRELRRQRLVAEKEKVEALAKQKKLLKMKQKRAEMLQKFGRDSNE